MPFTPFHFGPGLLVKAAIPHHFSLSMFALANVAMDVEPLYRMLYRDAQLHGATHTLIGAGIIGAATALSGLAIINHLAQWFERLHPTAGEPFHISIRQAWLGALLGTFSHLSMDALMHDDMQPFLPFTDANPWLVVSWTENVYLGCVLAGMAGLLLILIRTAINPKNSLEKPAIHRAASLSWWERL
jgi:membrane-bound metal-dependent hydrolase YbcI (DUF457 family)